MEGAPCRSHVSTIATAAIATAALGGVVVPAGAGTAAPVAPTASYHVTLSISATSATAREDKVALTGTVTPKPPEDSVVKVQVKYENQNIWKKAGTATIKNNGKYRFLVEPESHLDRVYRVVKAADDKATADKSPVRSLDVIGWSWLTKLTPSATENMSFAPNMPINGEDYSHTLYVNRAWDAGYTEFTLGRKCLTLETTLGLSDRTRPAARLPSMCPGTGAWCTAGSSTSVSPSS